MLTAQPCRSHHEGPWGKVVECTRPVANRKRQTDLHGTFFCFRNNAAIRKIKKVVPGHISTVWSPLIRLESARAVRTVTERSILRVPATAQGNGRLVGAQGISVTCRIGQLDRSLHKQRAIGSHPNFYVGHESLLFFRWIFPASHPNQDRYPQLHSC